MKAFKCDRCDAYYTFSADCQHVHDVVLVTANEHEATVSIEKWNLCEECVMNLWQFMNFHKEGEQS